MKLQKIAVPVLVFLIVAAAAASILAMELELMEMESYPDPVSGMDYTFYNDACPQLESIVESRVASYLGANISQAAGLLRLFFHDCFVIGCDASILLVGNSSETTDIPNLTIRQAALDIISDIKVNVEAACPGTVSCADIVALAARDSVFQAGGPWFPMPTGRRDNPEFASSSVVLASLPRPTQNVTSLLPFFQNRSLNVIDLVALSGGHTIGLAHCSSLTRLFPTQDTTLSTSFSTALLSICPNASVNATVNNDRISPNFFDNTYFVDLVNNNGLFVSDQSLFNDTRTMHLVSMYAKSRQLFYSQFSVSMIKMGMLGVLVGTQGEIRLNCSVPNSNSSFSFPTNLTKGDGRIEIM